MDPHPRYYITNFAARSNFKQRWRFIELPMFMTALAIMRLANTAQCGNRAGGIEQKPLQPFPRYSLLLKLLLRSYRYRRSCKRVSRISLWWSVRRRIVYRP